MNRRRLGAAAVEFALVAPLLIMLTLGMVEFGRMMMVKEIVTNAAREGARKAVLPGVTDADVLAVIDSYVSQSGIAGHSRQVSPSTTTAAAGTAIRVTVTVPYEDVSWLPAGTLRWLGGKTLTATVEMRKDEY